ncbi:MAG: hypothetical protein WCO23_00495 [bacterium]
MNDAQQEPINKDQTDNLTSSSTDDEVGCECSHPQNNNYSILDHRKLFESSFYIYPESPEENKIQKARAILGESVADVPDSEMAVYITQFQYLLDSWLDIYEKEIFNGLTLQQMLREG